MTEAEVRVIVGAAIHKAGSLRALAKEWGVSPPMLSDVMTGRRGPGPKILNHLKLVRVVTVTYEPWP
jgi:lambda repressor-like predicted transcriptional regulator